MLNNQSQLDDANHNSPVVGQLVKRSRIVTFLLTLFSPMVGMFYIGRGWLGLAYLGISSLGIITLVISLFLISEILIIFFFIPVAFIIINIGAAFKVIETLEETGNIVPSRWYNKWYLIIPLFVVFGVLYPPFKYYLVIGIIFCIML